jgi:hypothetical protein
VLNYRKKLVKYFEGMNNEGTPMCVTLSERERDLGFQE